VLLPLLMTPPSSMLRTLQLPPALLLLVVLPEGSWAQDDAAFAVSQLSADVPAAAVSLLRSKGFSRSPKSASTPSACCCCCCWKS
jgi:hypothetical protein